MSRIMIPRRLCSIPIHSPGICMLGVKHCTYSWRVSAQTPGQCVGYLAVTATIGLLLQYLISKLIKKSFGKTVYYVFKG